MSPFMGLHIGLSALLANQKAMEVISHNIANINTPGYSRQDVTMEALINAPAEDMIQGQLGAGVRIRGIRRLSDAFVLQQIRSENQGMGRYEALTDVLRQLEVVLREPSDEGLSASMDVFFGSFQDLVTNPESLAARTGVVQAAEHLANLFQSADKHMQDLRYEFNDQVRANVTDINNLAQNIANLNVRISKISILGEQPNDLLDQRDVLVDDLSKLVEIHPFTTENGTLKINIGGHELVTDQGATTLEVYPDGANDGYLGVRWTDNSADAQIDGGKLYGILEARDQVIPNYQAELDTVASKLIERVNTVHSAGFGIDNSTGLDFFTGSGASDIAVNTVIADDERKVAAASVADAPGDGSNALAMASIQTEGIMDNGATLSQYYGGLIAQLGLDAQHAQTSLRGQELLVGHLTARKESLSGVSLDEETVKLISHQRAYEAAARVITTIDEMLDQLINRTGIVGR